MLAIDLYAIIPYQKLSLEYRRSSVFFGNYRRFAEDLTNVGNVARNRL